MTLALNEKKQPILMEVFFLLPCFYLTLSVCWADTVVLKDGESLKGLVVEEHSDRIVLSTVDGEIQVMRSKIEGVHFDSQEQSFVQIASDFEAAGKWEEALSFYEKAYQLNPGLEKARQAALALRGRLWAQSLVGPTEEVDKQTMIMQSWSREKPIEEIIQETRKEEESKLKERTGLVLGQEGEWVVIRSIKDTSLAKTAGLKNRDRLVSLDGHSLRYLSVEVVERKLVSPGLGERIIEVQRDILYPRDDQRLKVSRFGLKLNVAYEGLKIQEVAEGSPAKKIGLKPDDFLIAVNGRPTRYLPLREVIELIESPESEALHLTIYRSIPVRMGT